MINRYPHPPGLDETCWVGCFEAVVTRSAHL